MPNTIPMDLIERLMKQGHREPVLHVSPAVYNAMLAVLADPARSVGDLSELLVAAHQDLNAEASK